MGGEAARGRTGDKGRAGGGAPGGGRGTRGGASAWGGLHPRVLKLRLRLPDRRPLSTRTPKPVKLNP